MRKGPCELSGKRRRKKDQMISGMVKAIWKAGKEKRSADFAHEAASRENLRRTRRNDEAKVHGVQIRNGRKWLRQPLPHNLQVLPKSGKTV